MIASLPMYDREELAPANDRLWALIRDDLMMNGHGAPDFLSRDTDPWEDWQSPDLVFSQTCGFPYRSDLHEKVNLVGTPDYGVLGCAPGYYRSMIVVRAGDPRRLFSEFNGANLAYNDPKSQSGWAAFAQEAETAMIAAGERICTGSHRASVQAVAENAADIAAIDAVTWEIMQRYDPVTERLRVLLLTRPTPGLPFITAKSRDPEPILRAISAAIPALQDGLRARLRLRGVVMIPSEDYLAQPIPPEP